MNKIQLRMSVVILLMFGFAMSDDKLENLNSAMLKDSKVQDEILKAMKDSGVLNEWKEKLDDILFKDNQDQVDPSKTKEKKSMITTQEKEMLTSFIDAYIYEHALPVSTDLVMHIIERAVKTPAPNLPMLFVQLGPVIDVLSAIAKKTKNIEKIVERQSPVLDSPSKTKDVLHTLVENLKSELVRLTLDAPAPKKRSPPPPPPKKPVEKKKSGLDMSDYLTLGSTLLKGGNAGQLLNMFSGGQPDMSTMMNLLPGLIQSGNYKDILMKMASSYLEGTPWGPIVQRTGDDFLASEYGLSMVEKGYSFLETFATTESGKRLMAAAPQMIAAKDLESFLAILSKEAEFNWSKFFANIDNADYKAMLMERVSGYLLMAYDAIHNPPKGSMLAKAPILLNGFLISYRIPTFDSKKPSQSITAILNKCIKLFSTWKLDVGPYVETATTTFNQAFEKQMKGNKFGELDLEQKKAFISRSLDNELVEPIQTVWLTFSHLSEGAPECAPHLLCAINQREFHSGAGESRKQVVKGASLAASWALAQNKCDARKSTGESANKDKYWELYKAVWSGAKGEDCTVKFPTKDKKCNLFSWQSKNYMNTQYDHIEL
jgi:hypothetical protein